MTPGLALVICDAWDTHWCATARRQLDDLAPRIDAVARAVRRSGGIVIHAPSQTDAFYDATPQYERALRAARPLGSDRPPPTIALPQHPTCPCEPPCAPPDTTAPWPWPWRRQHERIDIAAEDHVACDNADVVNGVIQTAHAAPVVLCGLHLDECVLDRPFGAKALWAGGIDVVILEDLTEPAHPSDRAAVLSAIARSLPVVSSATLVP
jgi:nicotinamidase-related amidase